MEFNDFKECCRKHELDVSRETFEQLRLYIKLLKKWNNKINLISKGTIDEVWLRHIVDSMQLLKYINTKNSIITDFGSGAGLPGVILSICGIKEIHLVESDMRKSAFLLEASKLSNQKIIIHNTRIENLKVWYNDIIIARAFAPLKNILDISKGFIGHNKKWLLLKGHNVINELKEAEKIYSVDYILYNSITFEDAYVLQINSYKHK
ncbi:Ribosomal RNA small subunit methyltransferase G [Rickettsiales bacterium Ac37b]|nr:Ribosomal RNA small subunit methyltransferase G [Rickettsiales bacterium Ac37b]